jgi:hypothetical protein
MSDEDEDEDETWSAADTAAVAAHPSHTPVVEDVGWWRRRTPSPPPPRPSSPQPDYITRYAHYLAPNAAYLCGPGVFSYAMIRPSPWLPGALSVTPNPQTQAKPPTNSCVQDALDNGDSRTTEELAAAGLLVPPPPPTTQRTPHH